jgi:hypothetical protein
MYASARVKDIDITVAMLRELGIYLFWLLGDAVFLMINIGLLRNKILPSRKAISTDCETKFSILSIFIL